MAGSKLSPVELGVAVKEWIAGAEPAEVAKALAEWAVHAGGLIGVSASSKLLGIATPNFRRYRERLTEVPVEGSAAVFLRREVGAVAEELQAARRSG